LWDWLAGGEKQNNDRQKSQDDAGSEGNWQGLTPEPASGFPPIAAQHIAKRLRAMI
jgi:hypothetical protein